MSPSGLDPAGRDTRDTAVSRPVEGASADGAVVVGATPDAEHALAWGLRHAARHHLPVRLVRAHDPAGWWPDGVADALGVTREGVQDVLARAVRTRVRRLSRFAHAAEIEPTIEVRDGPTVDVLLAQARRAAMLVVGHRARPALSLAGLGSVARALVRRAPVPVTVVRALPDDGPVLVGLDGSAGSVAALAHALREGVVRDVPTVVLCAATPVVPHWADRVVDTVREGVPDAGPVDLVATDRDPVPALLDAAFDRRAAVLVVGRRGPGTPPRSPLGSVGRALVDRAGVTVTVVAPRAAAGARDEGPGPDGSWAGGRTGPPGLR